MKHAEKLIGRIIFLEGIPIVDNLRPLHIGADVPKMFANDHDAESDAIKSYNSFILVCVTRKTMQPVKSWRAYLMMRTGILMG